MVAPVTAPTALAPMAFPAPLLMVAGPNSFRVASIAAPLLRAVIPPAAFNVTVLSSGVVNTIKLLDIAWLMPRPADAPIAVAPIVFPVPAEIRDATGVVDDMIAAFAETLPRLTAEIAPVVTLLEAANPGAKPPAFMLSMLSKRWTIEPPALAP